MDILARGANLGKVRFPSALFIFLGKPTSILLLYCGNDMKLPEFPSNQSLGRNLLLGNQDPSAVLNFHFKGSSVSAFTEPNLGAQP